MAEEPTPTTSPSGKGRMLPVVIVALLMIGEGIGIYFLAKAMSAGPEQTLAAEGEAGNAPEGEGGLADREDLAEVELAECRPSNKISGRFITFQVAVSALVPTTELERAEELIKAKRARIRDRVNFVIRSAELKQLNEPGLETIKRRFKRELGRVFNDDTLIREVLITEWLQSNSGV